MKNYWFYFISILVTVCAVVNVSEGEATIDEQILPPAPEGKTWKLTWSDEFEGKENR